MKKTKIMVVDEDRLDTSPYTISGEQIEEVDKFVYLGSTITRKGHSTPEITRRLAMVREAVQKMTNNWRSKGIQLTLKVRLLHAIAFPIAKYGSESRCF